MSFRVRERDKLMARGRRNQAARMKRAKCHKAFKYDEEWDRITNIKSRGPKGKFP